MSVRQTVAALGCLVAALPAAAVVLTTITVDGSMGDWDAVLADPRQNAFDGPAGGLPDRDAAVDDPTHDLTRFAWTYDATDFFVYFERDEAHSGRERVWLYLDTDADDTMESGEPVVQIDWWGKSRATQITLNAYVPAAAAGDPLGDPSGLADGWTMPGTLNGGTTFPRRSGGASDRRRMEEAIPWSAIGVGPGSPMRFHVSSSSGAQVPGDIQDNMGGPGGVIGVVGVFGVDLTPPSRALVVSSGGGADAPLNLTNTGQAAGRFELSWTASGAFAPATVAIYRDVDGDGTLSPGDLPLADTDGDGTPDTGILAAGSALALVVRIDTPAGLADGATAALEVRATSAVAPAVSDVAAVTLTIATPVLTLVKSVSAATVVPGDAVTWSIDWLNSGGASAYEVVVVDVVPSPTVYEPGSASGPGATIEFSHDGGLSWDTSDAAPVTHVRFRFTTPLAPGASGSVAFRSRVP